MILRAVAAFVAVSCLVSTVQTKADAARAQDVAQRFDVASVKRNISGTQQGTGLAAPQPGGRYIAIGATLEMTSP